MQLKENVIAYVSAREARHAVQAATGTARDLQFCSDETGLVQLAATRDVGCVVWEITPGADRTVEAIARALSVNGQGARLFVTVDLSRGAARQLMGLASHLPYAYVSLRSHDDLATDLARWLREGADASAYPTIVKRLHNEVCATAADVIMTAAFVGRRRTHVGEFAQVCGLPHRTLEAHLASAQLPAPAHLLGLMASLHTAWRLDVLSLETHRAAAGAGFRSVKALSRHVECHAHLHLRDLRRQGAFGDLLDRIGGSMRDIGLRRVSADS